MNIQLVEVLWKYGVFPAAKLPVIAKEVLDNGFYGPVTAEIAAMVAPDDHAIGDLFERAILEIRKNFMDDDEMPEVVAKGIVDKEINPLDGVYILSKLYKDLDSPEELKIFDFLYHEYQEYLPPKYLPYLKVNRLIPVFRESCDKDITRRADEYLRKKIRQSI
ncbi:MAG: hypothetical protein ACJ75J_14575 [Cytophagaceae bacterium]